MCRPRPPAVTDAETAAEDGREDLARRRRGPRCGPRCGADAEQQMLEAHAEAGLWHGPNGKGRPRSEVAVHLAQATLAAAKIRVADEQPQAMQTPGPVLEPSSSQRLLQPEKVVPEPVVRRGVAGVHEESGC